LIERAHDLDNGDLDSSDLDGRKMRSRPRSFCLAGSASDRSAR
jgi:hypothetical protein